MKKPKLEIYNVSYQGKRKKNEDVSFIKINNKFKIKQVILGVADGMGGYEKGNVASQIAASEIEKVIEQNIPPDPRQAKKILGDSIKKCNELVYAKGNQHEDTTMGTTITGAVFRGNNYLVFNVGDSRTYKVTSDGIRQITEDHSADVDAFKNGIISKEEVGKGFYSHALVKSVGTDQTIEPDIFPANNDTFFELQGGEVIVSCTDGMWGLLSDKEIHREIVGRASLKESFESLVSLSYLKGSTDNISIAGIEYGELKRKNLNLKKYPPPNQLMKRHKQRKSVWMPLLLTAALLGFLITSYFIYHLMTDKKSTTTTGPEKSPATQRIKADIHKPSRAYADIRIKPEMKTHEDKVQVEIAVDTFKIGNYSVEKPVIYYSIDEGKARVYQQPFQLNHSAAVTAWAEYRLGDSAPYRTETVKKKYEVKPKPKRKIPKKPTVVKVDTVDDVMKLDENIRTLFYERTKKFILYVEDINRAEGKISVKLSLRSDGKIDKLSILVDQLKVNPPEKKTLIIKMLKNKINAVTFPSPLKEGKKVKLKKFWFDLKVNYFGSKIILTRSKN
jgi:serine/threonine protein phosphatase PrpC